MIHAFIPLKVGFAILFGIDHKDDMPEPKWYRQMSAHNASA